MERMQCDNCGHVYDKDEGDPKNNVAPGTAWADVPADYKCPECGAGKDKFIIEQMSGSSPNMTNIEINLTDLYKLGGERFGRNALFFAFFIIYPFSKN